MACRVHNSFLEKTFLVYGTWCDVFDLCVGDTKENGHRVTFILLNQVTACHISEIEASLCQASWHYIDFILLQLL